MPNSTYYIYMCILKIVLLLNCAELVLNVDLSPGGSTGLLEIKVGDSANLTCRLNPRFLPKQNSSDLKFINETATYKVLPSTNIVQINETAIIYMLRNASAQKSTFRCFLGNDIIAQTPVNVGWAPQPVQNFDCYGYDFEYMVCKFTPPYNPVSVNYKLMLYYRDESYKIMPSCNYNKSDQVVCNITRPEGYKPSEDLFNFKLLANNSLNISIELFKIDHVNVMIPAAPGMDAKVILLNTTATSISWRMLKHDYYKSKGLQWDVQLLAQNNSKLNFSNTWSRSRSMLQLKLFDLPYAYYNYTLILRVGVTNSNKWSDPFVHKFQTLARKPDRPPRINVGSFYIDSNENTVRLYWEELEDFERNGENFTYVVTEVKKDGKIM